MLDIKKTIVTLGLASALLTAQINANESGEYSSNYEECLRIAGGEHPKMIDCLKDEKNLTRQVELELLGSTYTDETQARVISRFKEIEPTWELYVKEKCSIHMELGGQRGELLSNDCALTEELKRLKFMRVVLAQSEI